MNILIHMEYSEDYIQHYGTPGMKWGVRKKSSSSSKSSKGKTSSARKSLKDMSDDDIKKALDRMDLEKRYISAMTPTQKTAGKKMISTIMTKAGENIGTQLATYAMGSMVNTALKGMVPDGVVNPKKGQKDK